VQAALNWISSNWVALLGLLIIWLVYRLGKADERRGVLRGLREELRLHALWVGNAYPPPAVIPDDWKERTYMVNKLSTIAVETAVARGPALFLNRDLLTALVGYRQAISHLHQLIDSVMLLQANPELWRPAPSPQLLDRIMELTTAVHVYAIGTDNSGAAHQHFRQLLQALQGEMDTRVLPVVWILTGLNFFRLKRWLLRYL
jgi:hypothetical protein